MSYKQMLRVSADAPDHPDLGKIQGQKFLLCVHNVDTKEEARSFLQQWLEDHGSLPYHDMTQFQGPEYEDPLLFLHMNRGLGIDVLPLGEHGGGDAPECPWVRE